jgi:hypothetical protein
MSPARPYAPLLIFFWQFPLTAAVIDQVNSKI